MTNFNLSKLCVYIVGFFLICITALTLISCDKQSSSEYASDPKARNLCKKFKLRKNDQVWERVRKNFDMASQSKQQVKPGEVERYVKEYANATQKLDKASPYMYYIIDEVEKRDMPGEIALLPMIESAFEPKATSHKAAAGLWQFIPSTGKHFGLKQDKYYDGRRDVKASTKAALDYLEILHKQFDNNWMLALAAYNAGEGTIQKAIKKNRKKGKPTRFSDLDIPTETKKYVPKLMGLAEVVKNPEKHNISLPHIADKPYFESVNLGKPVDLNNIAKVTETEVGELKRLNAGYTKTHTHPSGPQQVLMPIEKVAVLRENIDKLSTVTPAANESADTVKKLINKKGKKHKAHVSKKKSKAARHGKGKKRAVKPAAVKGKKISAKSGLKARRARAA